MGSLKLEYALPASRFRFDAKVTVTHDKLFEKETPSPQTVVALEIGATARDQTLEATTGWFRNTATSFSLSEDGRLTSTELESTGEVGSVVLGVTGAAITVAAATLGPGGIGAAAAAAAAKGFGASHLAAVSAGFTTPETEKPTPEQIEAAAFREHDRETADRRIECRELVRRTAQGIADATDTLLKAETPEQVTAATKRLASLRAALPVIEARLDALNTIFNAWRATTIETRAETIQKLISLDRLIAAKPALSQDGTEFHFEQADAKLEAVWSDLGVMVTVDSPEGLRPQHSTPGENEVLVRIPREVVVNVYEKGPDEKPVLRESKPHLVMDSLCDTKIFKLRKSIWAKRSVTLGFNDLGGLSSYKQNSGSAASAAASTLGSLPGTVTGSLESGAKLREQVAAIGSSGVQQQLAKVKAEAELKQQEVTKLGLNATAADAEALAKLKQQAEKLDYEDKIGKFTASPAAADPTDTEIAALKQQLELLMLQTAVARFGGS